MNELVDFLNARLRDEEQMARAADGVTWTATKGLHDFSDGGGLAEMVTLTDSEGTPIATDLDGTFTADDLVHIARHDPARVLREVEAKREIVDLHAGGHECSSYDSTSREINNCQWVMDVEDCTTMHLLASVYADHPDYRKEWGPDGS